MLISEFPVEAIIICVKSIKKGIEWYIHFIRKPVILCYNFTFLMGRPIPEKGELC